MKNALRVIASAGITAALSAFLFYMFVIGLSVSGEEIKRYLIVAAGLSVLLPAVLCVCVNYIIFLYHKGEKLLRKQKKSDQA